MTTTTRTHLALALRQYNQGMIDFDAYYHTICNILAGE